MRTIAILPLLALGACQTTQSGIVERHIPIPVKCSVTVSRPAMPLDRAVPDLLESQNAVLRGQVATQAGYIVDLEAAVTGCGGVIGRSDPTD